MSLSASVNQAIIQAKLGLGDLVIKVRLQKISKTYDASLGKYVQTVAESEIEGVADTFTYSEQMAQDFNQSDVKFSVFNPTNDLEINTEDRVVFNDVEMSIIRVQSVYAGAFRPMITLVLRK